MTAVSLGRALVRLLRARQREGLPQAIRDKALLHIADAVGIGIGARDTALAAQVDAAGNAGGSGGICGVLGSASRTSAAQAAFANAARMHILDFDDIHDAARLHPTTVTLAAALAAASLSSAPGRRVAEAVALGDELICRLGVMLSPQGQGPGSDWFLTQLFGYLGAAFASGLVLDQDENRIVSSLGLAYMQAAGGKQAGFGTGSTARAIYPAFAAMGGIQASLIAAAGIAGPEQSLDGAAGLLKIYLGVEPDEQRTFLLLDPAPWHFEDVRIKPWPSCRLSHPYVAAALALREVLGRQGVAIEHVRRVEVGVNASAAKLCRPLAERRRPATLQDAKYSIPWMVAFTLARGSVDLATLNDDALPARDIHALADRVEIVENLPDRPGHPPAEIRVELPDGRTLESPREIAYDPSPQAVRDKFEACLAQVGLDDRAMTLWENLLRLDAAPTVDFLFRDMDPGSSPG